MTLGFCFSAEKTTGLPSTVIASPGTARSPSFAVLPLTATRPASTQPSIARREPRPAAARTFCSRSACGAGSVLLLGLAVGRTEGGVAFVSLRSAGRFELEGFGDFFKRRQLLQ